MDTIGERLAYTRNTLSMNQAKFASILGISQGSLSEIEKNKRGLPLEAVIKLMNYSNSDNQISCIWILTGKKEEGCFCDLNNDERELISTYKKLDRRGQHRIHTVIYEELDRMELQKKKKAEKYTTSNDENNNDIIA